MVGEPTPEESEKILFGLRDKYEAHHKLKISDEAIKAAVTLSVRYINDRFLPDKAIDLIDEAASKKRISNMAVSPEIKELRDRLKEVAAEKEEAILSEDYEKAASLRDDEKKLTDELEEKTSVTKGRDGGDLTVTAEDIADIVSSWTGIPVKKLAEEESEKLANLESILKQRIIGHPLVSTDLFSAVMTEAERAAIERVGEIGDSVEIASIELLGEGGPSIPITIPIPDAAKAEGVGLIQSVFEQLRSFHAETAEVRAWE